MRFFIGLIGGLACALHLNAAHSWPQFRGPNGSGVSPDAKPPLKFGTNENLLWKVEVPASPSSPCIWDDHIFLTTFDDGKLQLRAYRRNNGDLLWSKNFAAPALEAFHLTEGSPVAGTPATDGKHVVVYFGSLGVVALDFNGRELWTAPLPIAQTSGGFGSGTSPIIVGDNVILNRDQQVGSSLLAFDIKTGKKIWETPRPDAPTSYGTPAIWKRGNRTDIIVPGSLFMRGYDPQNGSLRWTMRGMPSFTCPSAVVAGDMIYFSGWSPGKSDMPWPTWASTLDKYDKNADGLIVRAEFGEESAWFDSQDIDKDGTITKKDWTNIEALMARGENSAIALKAGGEGDVTEKDVAWRFTRGLPYVPTILHYDGRIYMIKDGGMMTCLDAKSGQAIYTQERIDAIGGYQASPVAADGRIYVASIRGKVSVIKAGGDKPEILHQADFGERVTATMAFAGNHLYFRTATKLYAFGGKTAR